MNKIKLIKELLENGKVTKEEALVLASSNKTNYLLTTVGLILLLVGQVFAKETFVVAGQQLPDTNLVQIAGFIMLIYPLAIKAWYAFQNKKNIKNYEGQTEPNIESIDSQG